MKMHMVKFFFTYYIKIYASLYLHTGGKKGSGGELPPFPIHPPHIMQC